MIVHNLFGVEEFRALWALEDGVGVLAHHVVIQGRFGGEGGVTATARHLVRPIAVGGNVFHKIVIAVENWKTNKLLNVIPTIFLCLSITQFASGALECLRFRIEIDLQSIGAGIDPDAESLPLLPVVPFDVLDVGRAGREIPGAALK